MDDKAFLETFSHSVRSVPERVLMGWGKHPEVFKKLIEDFIKAAVPVESMVKRRSLFAHELTKMLAEGTSSFTNDVKEVKSWNGGRTIRVVELTPRQLGLYDDDISFKELVARATDFGYKKCPLSTILFHQPSFEGKADVYFANVPLRAQGSERLFVLRYGVTDDAGGWGSSGYPYWTRDTVNAFWRFGPETKWIFAV